MWMIILAWICAWGGELQYTCSYICPMKWQDCDNWLGTDIWSRIVSVDSSVITEKNCAVWTFSRSFSQNEIRSPQMVTSWFWVLWLVYLALPLGFSMCSLKASLLAWTWKCNNVKKLPGFASRFSGLSSWWSPTKDGCLYNRLELQTVLSNMPIISLSHAGTSFPVVQALSHVDLLSCSSSMLTLVSLSGEGHVVYWQDRSY